MSTETPRSIFVTVGTTQFDALVERVCCQAALELLASRGVGRLVVQHGRSPPPLPFAPLPEHPSFSLECYPFKPSLRDDLQAADLVVSHAGAGSIMEVLELGKPLLVVVNDSLMDNHQAELAGALSKRSHLVATTPSLLLDCLRIQLLPHSALLSSLVPLPPVDPSLFPRLLSQALSSP